MASKSNPEVERIAKLLYRASERSYAKHNGCAPYLWRYENDECRERFRDMARAVIRDRAAKPARRKSRAT